MKTRYLIAVAVAIGIVGGFILLASPQQQATTGAPAPAPQATAKVPKPPCAFPGNPSVAVPTDCTPDYIANLPPDPGEAGKATLKGVITNKTGVRDDVLRWIVDVWGDSPTAVEGLKRMALMYQRTVEVGGSLGPAETRKQFADKTMREAMCASRLQTREMLEGSAYDMVRGQVLNTPERFMSAAEWDQMFANGVYDLPNITATEACGFDPDALATAEGKQTIASQLIAESIASTAINQRAQREEDTKREAQDAEQERKEIERAVNELKELEQRK